MTNRSLQAKSAARLAAAQLLYTSAMSGKAADATRLMAEYDAMAEGGVAPNKTLLRALLEGVITHAEALEPWVEKALTGEWKKARMSPLLLAILRLGVFELTHFHETKAPIIINEYVTLTGRFFESGETGFVNAALNALAKEIREG